MSMRKEILQGLFIAMVDYLFFIYAEPYIPSELLRFVLIGLIDIIALYRLYPVVRPLINAVLGPVLKVVKL